MMNFGKENFKAQQNKEKKNKNFLPCVNGYLSLLKSIAQIRISIVQIKIENFQVIKLNFNTISMLA